MRSQGLDRLYIKTICMCVFFSTSPLWEAIAIGILYALNYDKTTDKHYS